MNYTEAREIIKKHKELSDNFNLEFSGSIVLPAELVKAFICIAEVDSSDLEIQHLDIPSINEKVAAAKEQVVFHPMSRKEFANRMARSLQEARWGHVDTDLLIQVRKSAFEPGHHLTDKLIEMLPAWAVNIGSLSGLAMLAGVIGYGIAKLFF